CVSHVCVFFFFNDTATTEIYTLSLHDALPIWVSGGWSGLFNGGCSGSFSMSRSCAPSRGTQGEKPKNRRCPYALHHGLRLCASPLPTVKRRAQTVEMKSRSQSGFARPSPLIAQCLLSTASPQWYLDRPCS